MKFAILFFLAALPALAQTNVGGFTDRPGAISNSPPETFQSQTNRDPSIVEQAEQMRAACINGRRSICGKVLQILPDGLVVDFNSVLGGSYQLQIRTNLTSGNWETQPGSLDGNGGPLSFNIAQPADGMVYYRVSVR